MTEACEIRDHSSQTDLLVQILHPDDKKGSRCKKCKNSPTEKEALKDHVSAAHAANASVQTKEEINNYLAIQAQDSYKMPKTFEGYMCFYCDIRIISKAELEKHRCECHGRKEKSSVREVNPRLNIFPSFPNLNVENLLNFPPIGLPLLGRSYFPPLKM